MTKTRRVGVVSVGLIGLMAAIPLTVRAQAPAVGSTAPAVPVAKSVPALTAKGQWLGMIAQKLSKSSGMTVVTDDSLAMMPVTFNTIGGSLDKVLTQLAAALPPGVVVRAVLAPDNGGEVDGNAVATLLRAQDAFKPKPLTGVTAASVSDTAGKIAFTPGEFELLGQRVTLGQAASQMMQLHLKPVYVLLRQPPSLDPVARMNAMQAESMKLLASMTPDQQKQAFQIQFNSMMNMDSTDRQAMLAQMIQPGIQMMQAMQQMPPEQMKQFQQDVMVAVQKSGVAMPGAGGKGGAKPGQ